MESQMTTQVDAFRRVDEIDETTCVIPTMSDFSGLRRDAPLPFDIQLINGSKVAKVGEAMSYLLKLGQEKPRKAHWDIAIRMFSNAQREPAYLKAATISLQTAFALERLLLHM
jgi:DUF1680 family protein